MKSEECPSPAAGGDFAQGGDESRMVVGKQSTSEFPYFRNHKSYIVDLKSQIKHLLLSQLPLHNIPVNLTQHFAADAPESRRSVGHLKFDGIVQFL